MLASAEVSGAPAAAEGPVKRAWAKALSVLMRLRDPKRTRYEEVAHWVAIAACVFFTAVALWEAFGYARSGHYQQGPSCATAGENLIRWKKFAMVTATIAKAPTPDQYYCHHPYGSAMVEALVYLIFGHHWFTVRAGAAFCSALSAATLYGFGRRAWGIIPAAAATVFFCFCPIDLAFCSMGSLEVTTIAFALLFSWATAALWDTWKTRYIILAAIGAFGAANGDWVGLVLVGPVGVFGFLRAYVLPRRWIGRIDERQHARWFAWVTAMAVGTLLVYLYLFGKIDKIGDLMGSYELRTSGSESTWAETFSTKRKLWLGQMLNPLSYGALAAGVPLALVRVWKKPLEIVPLTWFFGASFQYLVFKQGADIHIFWPHYFGPAAALCTGVIVSTLMSARGLLLRVALRVRGVAEQIDIVDVVSRRWRVWSAAVLTVLVAIPLLLLVRVGLPSLVQARKTAGRMDDGGRNIGTDADLTQFAEWAFKNVAMAGSVVQVMEKFDFNYSAAWAVNRPHNRVNSLSVAKNDDPQRFAVVDTRRQSIKDLENMAKSYGVQAVGPFWRVDRATKGPQLWAHGYEERQPGPIEWMLFSGTDLVRTISNAEDPFESWAWRDALGLPANHPDKTPVSVNDLRVAHNIAVADKDSAREEDLRAKLAAAMGHPPSVEYTGGVRLRGVDIQKGSAIVVSLFWETDGGFKRVDANYQVKCKIVAPPLLWVGPTETAEKDMAPVDPIRPAAWKPGYFYVQSFVALHRIGREVCRGSFSSDLKPVSGDPNPILFTLD